MSSRFRAARHGVLLLAAATALLVAAPPALAASSGEYVGGVEGANVRIEGQANEVPTSLLRLKLDNDGTQLLTYCVELDVDARLGARMIESEWAAYPDGAEVFTAQPDKVLWILHHSYPNTALSELDAVLGTTLTEKEAIAGTQAAIWAFSNAAKLSPDQGNITKLYEYLTGEVNTGVGEQPPVSLSLTPEAVRDVPAGAKAGPFTVNTTGTLEGLTVEGPDGVEIVGGGSDQEIQPLDKDIFSVTEFWLSPPAGGAAGEGTVRATAQATVEAGRLFVGETNDKNPTQTLITAASTQTEVTAQATVNWVAQAVPAMPAPAAPAPQARAALADTGASVPQLVGLGVLLIGAGTWALLLRRRPNRSDRP